MVVVVSAAETVVFLHMGTLLKDDPDLVRLIGATLARQGFAGIRAPDSDVSLVGAGIDYFAAAQHENAEFVRTQVNALLASEAPTLTPLPPSCIPKYSSSSDRAPSHVHVWLQ